MVARKKQGGLTEEEKPIVKALLAKGWRNQDIQALVSTGREATINSGRITGVKQGAAIIAASDEEIAWRAAHPATARSLLARFIGLRRKRSDHPYRARPASPRTSEFWHRTLLSGRLG